MKSWKRLFLPAALLVIVILALSLYRAKAEADLARDRIAALEAERSRLEADIATLQAETAYLSRPERVDKLARSQLGMRPAEPTPKTEPPQ